jgi:hypothetical protein
MIAVTPDVSAPLISWLFLFSNLWSWGAQHNHRSDNDNRPEYEAEDGRENIRHNDRPGLSIGRRVATRLHGELSEGNDRQNKSRRVKTNQFQQRLKQTGQEPEDQFTHRP